MVCQQDKSISNRQILTKIFLKGLDLGLGTFDEILGVIWIWTEIRDFERFHYNCVIGIGSLLEG